MDAPGADRKKMIGFYLPVELHRLVEDVAYAEGRSISDVCRELIDQEQLAQRLVTARSLGPPAAMKQ